MWVTLFIVVLIGAVGYGYYRSEKREKVGKDSARPSTIPELHPEVGKLMDQGYSVQEALAYLRKRGKL